MPAGLAARPIISSAKQGRSRAAGTGLLGEPKMTDQTVQSGPHQVQGAVGLDLDDVQQRLLVMRDEAGNLEGDVADLEDDAPGLADALNAIASELDQAIRLVDDLQDQH